MDQRELLRFVSERTQDARLFSLEGGRIFIEFKSPNTNVGPFRVLGEICIKEDQAHLNYHLFSPFISFGETLNEFLKKAKAVIEEADSEDVVKFIKNVTEKKGLCTFTSVDFTPNNPTIRNVLHEMQEAFIKLNKRVLEKMNERNSQ